jgi:hypothetical protein
MRIKVKMNITKPLMRGTMVQIDDEGRTSWCPFAYEYMPDFCYICGVIGHVDRECKIKLNKGEKAQFGAWLKADMETRRADERSKGSGGGYRSFGGRGLGFNKWGGRSGSESLTWKKEGSFGGKTTGMVAEVPQGPLYLPQVPNEGVLKSDSLKGAQNLLSLPDENLKDEGSEKVDKEKETVHEGSSKVMDIDGIGVGDLLESDSQNSLKEGVPEEKKRLLKEEKTFKRRIREKSDVIQPVCNEESLTGKKRDGGGIDMERIIKRGRSDLASVVNDSQVNLSAGLQNQPRRSQ